MAGGILGNDVVTDCAAYGRKFAGQGYPAQSLPEPFGFGRLCAAWRDVRAWALVCHSKCVNKTTDPLAIYQNRFSSLCDTENAVVSKCHWGIAY